MAFLGVLLRGLGSVFSVFIIACAALVSGYAFGVMVGGFVR
jgi:hypothetical protein